MSVPFIPQLMLMYSTFRSFRHPFAVYLAAMFYLRRVRVPRCGIDEVKAEHRFLHYWRVEISVFLRDVLQQGVEAKATPRRIAKHHKPVLLSALIHALQQGTRAIGKSLSDRGKNPSVFPLSAIVSAFSVSTRVPPWLRGHFYATVKPRSE